MSDRLCSKNEYTKSESNSQQIVPKHFVRVDCVQRTNIQNLKAIHNTAAGINTVASLCSKNEYTKSESNSQQSPDGLPYGADCVQRTNIQNLKAIHNRREHGEGGLSIVFKERIYKI